MRKLAFACVTIVAALCLAWAVSYATINTSANKTIALGNGATTVFMFSFVGDQPGYISVIFTNASGIQTTLVQGPGPTQYQLSLNAAVSPGLWGVGGTVTYNPSGTPIPVGTSLTIIRTLPFVQNISLLNLASLSALANAAETGLDQLEMQIQQIAENINRVVAGPVSDPAGINYTLPAVAQRANQVMCFDSMGNVTACSALPSGTVSVVMQPVVNASTLAAGRAAFGLGSFATENINSGTLGGPSLQDDGGGNARVATTTVQDSTNQTVTCNFHLTQHIATGPITYTLPRANTCFNGFGFWVYGVPTGGNITMAANTNDNFVGLSSGTGTTIPAGMWMYVTTNAQSSGTWYARSNFSGPGIIVPMRTVTAAGAVTVNAVTDYFVCINKTVGSATTVNLPASPAPGQTFLIKDCKGDALTNNITLTPAAGNVDGAATFVMNINFEAAAITYNGVAWSIN